MTFSQLLVQLQYECYKNGKQKYSIGICQMNKDAFCISGVNTK